MSIKQVYNNYMSRRYKKQLRSQLIELEQKHLTNLTWSASLTVNIELLRLLRADMLSASGNDLSSIYLNTGFSSVVHLFDWTNMIIESLKNRQQISFEMVNITYQRKPIRLSDFLLTTKSKRYPIEALYINLSAELDTIMHHFNEIKDPSYADRSSAALSSSWVDVFAVVEMLCTIGVTDEQ